MKVDWKKIPKSRGKVFGLYSDWWLGIGSDFSVFWGHESLYQQAHRWASACLEYQQVSLTTPQKKKTKRPRGAFAGISGDTGVFQQPTHSAELAGRDQLPEYTVRYCKYTRHILCIKWTHLSASLINFVKMVVGKYDIFPNQTHGSNKPLTVKNHAELFQAGLVEVSGHSLTLIIYPNIIPSSNQEIPNS